MQRLAKAEEEVTWANEELAKKEATVVELEAQVKEAEESLEQVKAELGPEIPTVPVTKAQERETLLQQLLENRDKATGARGPSPLDPKESPTATIPVEKETPP